MRLFKFLIVLISVWAFIGSGSVSALGLGGVRLKSKLNQPLNAEIELTQVKGLSGAEISSRLASKSDFEMVGIQRLHALTGLQFEVLISADASGVIKVTSKEPVQEPFLNFLVEVKWPGGRLLREYTLLLDPPIFGNQIAHPVNAPSSRSDRSAFVDRSINSVVIDASAPQYPDATKVLEKLNAARYQVKNNDSLWRIAEGIRPDNSVTVEQVMVAILRLNPNAFIEHNINRLKGGVFLKIPDAQDAKALSHTQAVWQVSIQDRAWRQERRFPELDAKRRDPVNANEKLSNPVSRGRLSIVAQELPNEKAQKNMAHAGGGEVIQDALLASRESMSKMSRENDELRSRLSGLDEQIKTLRKLIMLKDDQMAAMQLSESEDTTFVTKSVIENIGANNDLVVQENKRGITPVGVIEPESQRGSEVKNDLMMTEPESESTPALALAPAPVPAPVPAHELAPAPEFESTFESESESAFESASSFFDSMLFLFIMGLVPVAGAVGFIYYRRRKSEELDDEDLEDEFDLETDLDSAGEIAEIDSELSIDEGIALNTKDNLIGDPLNDADVHIAYGRFDAAIELLNAAIGEYPDRTDLRVKVLEVYSEKGDADNFKNAFTQLEGTGNLDALKSASVLKARFPDDTFTTNLSNNKTAKDSADNNLNDFSLDLDDMEDDFDVGDIGVLDTHAEAPDIGLVPEADELSQSVQVEPPQGDLSEGIDFDIGNDVDEDVASVDALLSTSSDDNHSLEFEGSSLNKSVSSESMAPKESAGLEFPDLDFDVDGLDFGVDDSVDSATSNSIGQSDVDELEVEPLVEPVASGDSEGVEFDNDLEMGDVDDDLGLLSEEDEGSTKLDLARAYMDMGDMVGASDILDEIMESGSQEQQAEAKELFTLL